MRELTTNEVESVSGGSPSCGVGDPPPYGDGGSSSGGGFNGWLKVFVIVAR